MFQYAFPKNKDIPFHNHNTVIKCKKLGALISNLQTLVKLYQFSHSYLSQQKRENTSSEKKKKTWFLENNLFFLLRDPTQDHTLHLVIMTPSIPLISSIWNSSSSFVSHDLEIFEEHRPFIFFRMSINLDYANISYISLRVLSISQFKKRDATRREIQRTQAQYISSTG